MKLNEMNMKCFYKKKPSLPSRSQTFDMLLFIIDDKIFSVSGRLGLARESDCSVESDVGKIIFNGDDHKPAVARKSVIVPTFRNERE